jgi:triacylglycerol lipase
MQETLGTTNRLWVRGRLVEAVATEPKPSWWSRWLQKDAGCPQATLQTHVSGQELKAVVPIAADGWFEARLTAPLPVARRGWRIARNRFAIGEQSVEKCSVVLMPPDQATRAVVVVLPLEATFEPHGPQYLRRLKQAARVTEVLGGVKSASGSACAFYYLACVPPAAEQRAAELALAATALGWPSGTFVFAPANKNEVAESALHAMDALRWLFAGTLDLQLLNMEPSFGSALAELAEPKEDRAAVANLGDQAEDRAAGRRAGRGRRSSRSDLVPRHPVIFCHGMLAFSSLKLQLPEEWNCFCPLRDFLQERGLRALFPQVAPTGGVTDRARQLHDQIIRWTDEPINIIAHSMGGLDARYLITHLGMADRVASLTTIATPHHGTCLVEWFLKNIHQRVPLLLALKALGFNADGFRDVLPSACQEFNRTTPDIPQVRYFSYGGSVSLAHISPVLRRPWQMITAVEGPNDGMVSEKSAHWGEYLGTLHADHFAQTPDLTFVRPGENFDPLGFYFRLTQDLARRGF